MKSGPRWLGTAFTLLVAAYLLFRLTRLGWGPVLSSVPVSPLFYLALFAKILVLPVTQALAFREMWQLPFRRGLPAALIKRTLDKNVIDLSGDVYLYAWSKGNVEASPKEILLAIKDNLLMSAAASSAGSVLLLAVFLGADVIVVSPGRALASWRWAALGAAALIAAYLVYRFRSRILFLEREILVRVFVLHFGRFFLTQALQVVQWAAAMPAVPLSAWLHLLAAQIVIAFIPVMPSRNLVFFGAGLELSKSLDIDTTGMAGMLFAANAVVQGLNLALFLWASVAVKSPGRTGEADQRINGTGDGLRGPSAAAGSPRESAVSNRGDRPG